MNIIEFIWLINLENKIIVINLRIIILKYSAKKINANHPPMYSTLNPETNSDSPSAKSNGLRFTSAKHLKNQSENKIIFPHKNHNIFWDSLIWVKFNELDFKIINNIIKKNETSYEIICAILRIDPRWAYFELDDHPIINIEYTDKLDKIKNDKILCFISNKEKLWIGINQRIIIVKINDKAGEI